MARRDPIDKALATVEDLTEQAAGYHAEAAAKQAELEALDARAGDDVLDGGDADQIAEQMGRLSNGTQVAQRAAAAAERKLAEARSAVVEARAAEVRREATATRKRHAEHDKVTRKLLDQLLEHDKCRYVPLIDANEAVRNAHLESVEGVQGEVVPQAASFGRHLKAEADKLDRLADEIAAKATGSLTHKQMLAALTYQTGGDTPGWLDRARQVTDDYAEQQAAERAQIEAAERKRQEFEDEVAAELDRIAENPDIPTDGERTEARNNVVRRRAGAGAGLV